MKQNRSIIAIGAILLALVVGGVSLRYISQKNLKAPVSGSNVSTEPAAPAATTTPNSSQMTPGGTQDKSATGNTNGTTSTTDGHDNNQAMNIPATYTVQPGDTLRDIAQKYYHDPIYSADIERMNNLANPDVLMAGTQLKMPTMDDLKHVQTTTPDTSATTPGTSATTPDTSTTPAANSTTPTTPAATGTDNPTGTTNPTGTNNSNGH